MIEELRKELNEEVANLDRLIGMKQQSLSAIKQKRADLDAQIEQVVGEINQVIGQLRGTQRSLEKLDVHDPKVKDAELEE